jgi:tetratricopeptide (TPR) repeat protein
MSLRVFATCLVWLIVLLSAESSLAQTYKDFERRPTVLSETELERLKTAVMSRCHVPEGTDLAKAPWYFHYELGLELEKKGDPQRALDAFIAALDRRSSPQQGARMYGVWFIDYLPYFEIAKAHAALGNWECAADALRISADKKETQEGDKRFEEFLELTEETHLRAGSQPPLE